MEGTETPVRGFYQNTQILQVKKVRETFKWFPDIITLCYHFSVSKTTRVVARDVMSFLTEVVIYGGGHPPLPALVLLYPGGVGIWVCLYVRGWCKVFLCRISFIGPGNAALVVQLPVGTKDAFFIVANYTRNFLGKCRYRLHFRH